MRKEPNIKRCIAFIDGQNLYHAARTAFRATFPNYDPLVLVQTLCKAQGWTCAEVRFYTGMPTARDDRAWHDFWSRKLAAMGKKKIIVFSRPLRYRSETIILDGKRHALPFAEEKGIDVRLALDVIRFAHRKSYDVALIFSQDQDLSEVVDEVKVISNEQQRWIRIASAFPDAAIMRNRRGINGAEWIPIDRATYQSCIDPHDYRTPKKTPKNLLKPSRPLSLPSAKSVSKPPIPREKKPRPSHRGNHYRRRRSAQKNQERPGAER